MYAPVNNPVFSRFLMNYVSVITTCFISHFITKCSHLFLSAPQYLPAFPKTQKIFVEFPQKKFAAKTEAFLCMVLPPLEILVTSSFFRRIYAGKSGNLRCQHREA